MALILGDYNVHQIVFLLRHVPLVRLILLAATVCRGVLYWFQLQKVERSTVAEQSRVLERVTGEVNKY